MAGQEGNIQTSIVTAIKSYFEAKNLHAETSTPTSGQQTSEIQSSGRKPFDLSVLVPDITIFFLEIKHRQDNGSFEGFDDKQRENLIKLKEFGVDVFYAYNGWNYCRPEPKKDEILKQTHIRTPDTMAKQVVVDPIGDAITLLDYLGKIEGDDGASGNLLKILSSNLDLLDQLSSLTLVLLAYTKDKKISVTYWSDFQKLRNIFKLKEHEIKNEITNLAASQRDAEAELYSIILGVKTKFNNDSQSTPEKKEERKTKRFRK